MKMYKDGMSTYDMAMVAMLNDDGWMFAHCCDELRREGKYDELETAKRLRSAQVDAALADCPF